MKPMPHWAMLAATCSLFSMMLAPRASSTSAAPDLEETLRLPCLATVPPAAATTNMTVEEMLKECAPSPPVPTMSMKLRRSATWTGLANWRMTSAAAVISPMDSFLTRRPARMADVMTGETSPCMIMRIRCSISSWKISRWSMMRLRASCGVMLMMMAGSWLFG